MASKVDYRRTFASHTGHISGSSARDGDTSNNDCKRHHRILLRASVECAEDAHPLMFIFASTQDTGLLDTAIGQIGPKT